MCLSGGEPNLETVLGLIFLHKKECRSTLVIIIIYHIINLKAFRLHPQQTFSRV